jgi:DNA-binding MarR family transcriptional regulator
MESLHYLLMKAHTMLNRKIISGAADIGLSPGQPKILEYLTEFGENNQKTIADYCEIEQATVGSILLRMEAAGLISRTQKQGDRRAIYVSLTPAGREAARKMARVFAAQEEQAGAAMTAEELLELRRLLEKFCHSAIEKQGDMEP